MAAHVRLSKCTCFVGDHGNVKAIMLTACFFGEGLTDQTINDYGEMMDGIPVDCKLWLIGPRARGGTWKSP